MNVIDLLAREQEKKEVPVLRPGDSVRVHVKVVEGTRERIQVFEGVVIAVNGKVGLRTSFTVRRISHGVGVERTFLVHSPRIDRIDVLRHGQVRRAKLFYLREKVGKHARVRERREPIGGPEMTLLRGEPDEEQVAGEPAEQPEDGTAPAEPSPTTAEPSPAAAAEGSEEELAAVAAEEQGDG